MHRRRPRKKQGEILNSWFSVGIDFLSNNPAAIWITSGLITASALTGYWLWFRPQAVRLQRALVQVARSLDGGVAEGLIATKDHAPAAAEVHPHVAAAWRETEERVIPWPQGNAGPLPSFLDPLGGPDAQRQVWGRSRAAHAVHRPARSRSTATRPGACLPLRRRGNAEAARPQAFPSLSPWPARPAAAAGSSPRSACGTSASAALTFLPAGVGPARSSCSVNT